tara:strand:- start:374 stop:565 length:192 start_codon:yes stop_codon:yes gene_type:complete
MKTFCSRCNLECDVISVENFDWEEFWGAPVKRYYTDDISDCCEAEIEEVEDGDKDPKYQQHNN